MLVRSARRSKYMEGQLALEAPPSCLHKEVLVVWLLPRDTSSVCPMLLDLLSLFQSSSLQQHELTPEGLWVRQVFQALLRAVPERYSPARGSWQPHLQFVRLDCLLVCLSSYRLFPSFRMALVYSLPLAWFQTSLLYQLHFASSAAQIAVATELRKSIAFHTRIVFNAIVLLFKISFFRCLSSGLRCRNIGIFLGQRPFHASCCHHRGSLASIDFLSTCGQF